MKNGQENKTVSHFALLVWTILVKTKQQKTNLAFNFFFLKKKPPLLTFNGQTKPIYTITNITFFHFAPPS